MLSLARVGGGREKRSFVLPAYIFGFLSTTSSLTSVIIGLLLVLGNRRYVDRDLDSDSDVVDNYTTSGETFKLQLITHNLPFFCLIWAYVLTTAIPSYQLTDAYVYLAHFSSLQN